MSHFPLVSVIMSIYNGEKYLAEAIGSVLEQSYQNWELLAVNDGSTDSSEEILLSFRDDRIKYFYKKNGGVSSGRNLGLRKMNGDFFCFLDADDQFTKNSIKSRIQKFIAEPDCDFIDGTVVKMDAELKEVVSVWIPSFQGNPFEDLVRLTGKSFFGPSWMIRRKQGIIYQFRDGLTHCEDLLFYMELSRSGGEYDFVHDEALHYRIHGNSAMSNLNGLTEGYHQVYQWLRDNSEDFLCTVYKGRANRIITLSFLRAFQPIKALTKRIRE